MSARRRPGPAPKPATDPPDDLSAEQWNALSAWARKGEPWASAELEDLVAQCLDHHRSLGNVRADWVATCRTWVRNERIWRRLKQKGGGNGTARQAPPRGVAGASRALARHLGLFDRAGPEDDGGAGELH